MTDPDVGIGGWAEWWEVLLEDGLEENADPALRQLVSDMASMSSSKDVRLDLIEGHVRNMEREGLTYALQYFEFLAESYRYGGWTEVAEVMENVADRIKRELLVRAEIVEAAPGERTADPLPTKPPITSPVVPDSVETEPVRSTDEPLWPDRASSLVVGVIFVIVGGVIMVQLFDVAERLFPLFLFLAAMLAIPMGLFSVWKERKKKRNGTH